MYLPLLTLQNMIKIKNLQQKLALSGLLLFSVFPYSSAFADGLFSAKDNTIFAPFLNYQGQNYSAEFSLISPSQLQLKYAVPRGDSPAYGISTIVDNGLNFTLQRINYNGQLYTAEVHYQQGDIFSINDISIVDESISGRGDIIESNLLSEISQAKFNLLLSFVNLQAGTNIELSAKNDIQVYTVNHQTIDPAGELTLASALVAFPADTEHSYPLIAYQHGSETLRPEVPSQDSLDLPTLALAASGYMVVSADYLGLGESETLHPYVHGHTLATTIIDALRSARHLAAEQDIQLNKQLFLAGYSEGGYATMAAHREIQAHYSDEFTVTASAPIAGPYDLSGTMRQRLLDEAPLPSPFYFPYTVLAYNQVYGLSDQLSDFFQSPYDQTVSTLYDGNHSGSEINSALPDKQQLYTAALYDLLADGQSSWLQLALAENDSYRWIPEAPMYLFHCINDNNVPFENTQIAYDYFQSVGADQVQLFANDDALLNQGDVHTNCAIPLLLQGKAIFDKLVE